MHHIEGKFTASNTRELKKVKIEYTTTVWYVNSFISNPETKQKIKEKFRNKD